MTQGDRIQLERCGCWATRTPSWPRARRARAGARAGAAQPGGRRRRLHLRRRHAGHRAQPHAEPRRPAHARPWRACAGAQHRRRAARWASWCTRSRFVAEPGVAPGQRRSAAPGTPACRAAAVAGRRVAQRPGAGARQRAGPAHRGLGGVDLAPPLRCGPTNRLAEHGNTRWVPARTARCCRSTTAGPPPPAARAAAPTPRPPQVHTVRSRAELLAALRPGARPRIVQVMAHRPGGGRRGRPLDAPRWRDPGFDETAYVRAYDPATWGRDARWAAGRRPPRSARPSGARCTAPALEHHAHRPGQRRRLANGRLVLDGVDNVIVRNLHFSDAYDHFPAWDPRDNATANGTRATTTWPAPRHARLGRPLHASTTASRARRRRCAGPPACSTTTGCSTSRTGRTWSPCRGTTAATTRAC
jgi:hypothetical protein